MKYRYFETPKAGLADEENEDSLYVRPIKDSSLMVNVSDGASTGVFSRQWSRHITSSFDSAWLDSSEAFALGLQSMRESFKPDIKRPTALRKFLLEGSYATLSSVLIHSSRWWFGKINLTHYAVGDVCIFVFTDEGELEYSFPQKRKADFTNVPDLIRTSEKLQAKSPITIKSGGYSTSRNALIAVVTDALSEHLFEYNETVDKRPRDLIRRILRCKDNEDFRALMDSCRKHEGMKNDDASICFVTSRPDIYFEDDLWNTRL